MQLKLTTPLETKVLPRKKLELLPVRMDVLPSSAPSTWALFMRPNGARLCCAAGEAARIQDYMRLHGTEALSEDGETAYTLHGDCLVECNPDALANEI